MTLFSMRTLMLLSAASATALRAEPNLGETRSTLEKWVETRQLVSRARSDWQTDKETIEQSLQLFDRELKLVQEQLAKVSTNSAQVEKERLEAEAVKKASGESIEKARQFAAGFEARISQLIPQLPVPLTDTLKPLLRRMPTEPNTKMTAAERLQVIVGVLNELDKFNNAVSVFNERRKNAKGEEVAVDTVYVGLGAAYFVNEAGDFAGMGTPSVNGWEWTPRPELAAPVREVIRIYRNERPPRFIPLPVVLR